MEQPQGSGGGEGKCVVATGERGASSLKRRCFGSKDCGGRCSEGGEWRGNGGDSRSTE